MWSPLRGLFARQGALRAGPRPRAHAQLATTRQGPARARRLMVVGAGVGAGTLALLGAGKEARCEYPSAPPMAPPPDRPPATNPNSATTFADVERMLRDELGKVMKSERKQRKASNVDVVKITEHVMQTVTANLRDAIATATETAVLRTERELEQMRRASREDYNKELSRAVSRATSKADKELAVTSARIVAGVAVNLQKVVQEGVRQHLPRTLREDPECRAIMRAHMATLEKECETAALAVVARVADEERYQMVNSALIAGLKRRADSQRAQIQTRADKQHSTHQQRFKEEVARIEKQVNGSVSMAKGLSVLSLMVSVAAASTLFAGSRR